MHPIKYKNISIDGTRVFYRESGPSDAPVMLLLHGWPASSHMFRDLIPKLSGRFRLIAPDYPGFGHSEMPSPSEFDYSFDNISNIIDKFIDKLEIKKLSLYVQDYGGPVGFRVATRRPQLIQSIIVQNAIAHLDGVSDALQPLMNYWEAKSPENELAVRSLLSLETTKFQYLHGAANSENICPDTYTLNQALLDRAGNDIIQLNLLYDYRNNVEKFSEWQSYFRQHKPPMLVVWGQNDPFFTSAGAHAFAKENANVTVRLLPAGHFALEENSFEIATEILALADRVELHTATSTY